MLNIREIDKSNVKLDSFKGAKLNRQRCYNIKSDDNFNVVSLLLLSSFNTAENLNDEKKCKAKRVILK